MTQAGKNVTRIARICTNGMRALLLLAKRAISSLNFPDNEEFI